MRIAALVLIASSLLACRPSAPAPTLDPSADIVLRYPVAGGGELTFTVRPGYDPDGPIAFTVDVRAGDEPIRGPVAGRVLFSGVEGEVVIRELGASSLGAVEVAPGRSARVTVTWDGRDETGDLVPPESYSVTLDFVVGGETRRVGTLLRILPP